MVAAKRRARVQVDVTQLAQLLATHIQQPKWLDYDADLKTAKLQTDKFDEQLWTAILKKYGKAVFCKKAVELALKEVRAKKGDEWKMPDKKLDKWAKVMAGRFTCQATHLMRGIRQQSKWAMKIKSASEENETQAAETSDAVDEEEEEDGLEDAGDNEAEDEGGDDSGDFSDDEDTQEPPIKKQKTKAECKEAGSEGEAANDEEMLDDQEEDGSEKHFVGWHTEAKKAYRVKLAGHAGADAPEFAVDLEVPEDAESDDGMIAVWADGSKSTLPDYTIKDHKFHGATGVLPVCRRAQANGSGLNIGEKDGKKILVKPRRVGQKHAVVIFEAGLQVGQLIIDGEFTVEDATKIMKETAEAYVGGAITKLQIKKFKDDLVKAMKATKTNRTNDGGAGGGDAAAVKPTTGKRKAAKGKGQPAAKHVASAPSASVAAPAPKTHPDSMPDVADVVELMMSQPW